MTVEPGAVIDAILGALAESTLCVPGSVAFDTEARSLAGDVVNRLIQVEEGEDPSEGHAFEGLALSWDDMAAGSQSAVARVMLENCALGLRTLLADLDSYDRVKKLARRGATEV